MKPGILDSVADPDTDAAGPDPGMKHFFCLAKNCICFCMHVYCLCLYTPRGHTISHRNSVFLGHYSFPLPISMDALFKYNYSALALMILLYL